MQHQSTEHHPTGENNTTPNQNKPQQQKKLFIAIAIVGMLGLGGASSWHYVTGRPEYSLYLLQKAIANKNELAIHHHLDQETLVNNAIDRVWGKVEVNLAKNVAQTSENSNEWEALGASIGMAILENMKPGLKKALSTSVNQEIDRLIYGHGTAEASGSVAPEFKLVKVERAGDKAMATVQIANNLQAPPLQFSMSQNSDRTWKITTLSQQTIDTIWPDDILSEAMSQ